MCIHTHTHNIYDTFYLPVIVDTVRTVINMKDKTLTHLKFITVAEWEGIYDKQNT